MATVDTDFLFNLTTGYFNLIKDQTINAVMFSHEQRNEMRKRFLERQARRLEHVFELHKKKTAMVVDTIISNARRRGIQVSRVKRKRSDPWWETLVSRPDFEEHLLEHFHLNGSSFNYICESLRSLLLSIENPVKGDLAVEKQVAIALYKLTSHTEDTVVAQKFGVDDATVGKCFRYFCRAMVKLLMHKEITLPDEGEARRIIAQFETKTGVPQVLGAIDAIHIPVKPSSEDESAEFINRKGWPSLVLQAVVDCNYLFKDITCKYPGQLSDAKVLQDSFLYKRITRVIRPKKDISGKDINAFFVGDTAYPLHHWLVRGFGKTSTPEQESFNAYLDKTRSVIDTAFDRLRSRWGILQEPLDVDIKFVPYVVATCCILHNIAEKRESPFTEAWSANYNSPLKQPVTRINRCSIKGQAIRRHLMHYMAKHYPLVKRK